MCQTSQKKQNAEAIEIISRLLHFVGMTGFEPATTRPPDVYSTGLSYIPKDGANLYQKTECCKKNKKNISYRCFF